MSSLKWKELVRVVSVCTGSALVLMVTLRQGGLPRPGREWAAVAAESLQSCPTLCNPINGSPLGSSVPGILQARILRVGCHCLLQCMKVKSEVAQSCPTLSDPMDCSPPGSSVHEIFQARVLEWGAIAFSKRSIHCLYSQMA